MMPAPTGRGQERRDGADAKVRYSRGVPSLVRRLVLGVLLLVAAPVLADPAVDVRTLRVRRGGDAVPVAELVGDGPAVVALWMSYCLPCRAEAPVLNAARARWREDQVRLVVVLGDAVEAGDATRVAGEAGLRLPLHAIAGGQEDAVDALAPNGFPTNFLVAHGTVRRLDRMLRADDVAALVAPAAAVPPSPSH